ncbi:hypothetical protein MtrunA17_Chr8g0343771 [Medicago truncatula]|uniref:Uncharacterized protein n=1 Tax=Medicago truncatula TaxID=3880 RepID=A0A396GLA1_MEDTR|nr:uncharacterized protein DDB_G0285291-like [Medicago truncatula]RHN39435.1 hypothetical protein MtrunA17_Chr8g0343771 [Medicago truncatula]
MGSSNLASQLMMTNGALYAQQLQLSQQAPLNNQQNGQPAILPSVSGTASLLPLQQLQRQQQLASSAQFQQNSLTLNQQQLPQLMQRRSMGKLQFQQQQQQQLLQQQQQQQQLLQLQQQPQQQYQRLQQQLASSAQLQQNSLTLNQQQLPQLMQRRSMGQRQLQQQQIQCRCCSH